jgi:hypothetical protein
MQTISVMVPVSYLDKMDKFGAEDDRKRAWYVRSALQLYFDIREGRKKLAKSRKPRSPSPTAA